MPHIYICIYECVESVVRQQESICPCGPMVILSWTYPGPHSNDSLTLDQNRQALASSLSSSHLWRERLVLSHRIWCSLYYIIYMVSTLLRAQKAKERQVFFSSVSFSAQVFKREETYVILLFRLWGIKYVQHIPA